MHLLGLVVLGRAVAHALAGDDVHDRRATEAAGAAQRGLDGVFVVTVDRAEVFRPRSVNNSCGDNASLMPALTLCMNW